MGVSGRYKLVALLAVVLVATTAPAAATSPSLRATVQALRAVNAFRETVQPSSTSPGIRGSWSQKGIDYAREIAVGIISASVKKVTLPDIKFDKGKWAFELDPPPQLTGVACPQTRSRVRSPTWCATTSRCCRPSQRWRLGPASRSARK